MVVIIVQDDLIRQTLKGLLQRVGVEAHFYARLGESSAVIMEEPASLEALIVDYDIDPDLCQWLISGVLGLTERVRILVYSDFPVSGFEECTKRNHNLIIKEKPFILRDILDTIQSDTRRKHVSL